MMVVWSHMKGVCGVVWCGLTHMKGNGRRKELV